MLCFLFNYIDRNILSILAEDVKRDLGLSDSTIGFLYGTAFAVFYAVFGIAFGRLADAWIRKNLIAIGLFFWSLMTALTGTAGSFALLAIYRSASAWARRASPPAPIRYLRHVPEAAARHRALDLSGRHLPRRRARLRPRRPHHRHLEPPLSGSRTAPFGLAAWKVAFFAVGIPGLLMSFWVWTLREPPKGGQDEGPSRPVGKPEPLREFASVVPGLTLLSLWQAGAGPAGIVWNLAGAAALGLGAWAMQAAFGNPAQWYSLAVGLYAAFSWAQGIRVRERRTFDGILGNRTFMTAILGFGTMSFVTNGMAFWTAPFLLRSFDASRTEVGFKMGIATAIGGWIGVTIGGVLSDRLKAKRPTGRIDVALLSIVLSIPLYYVMVKATTLMGGIIGFLSWSPRRRCGWDRAPPPPTSWCRRRCARPLPRSTSSPTPSSASRWPVHHRSDQRRPRRERPGRRPRRSATRCSSRRSSGSCR